MKLLLVTGNKNKLREWQQIMASSIEMDTVDIDLPEIQSDDGREVVMDKARRAYEIAKQPVVVEDVEAGLEKLNGLPGPFIKFFMRRMGNDALYQLAGQEGERAVITASLAYFDGDNMIVVQGDVPGTVVAPRGDDGFGFDVTFVPDGESQTYAEMDADKKNALSHRSKAIRLLVKELDAAGLGV